MRWLACSGKEITIFALFYFVLGGKFQVQAPRGLYSEGRFNGGFFCVTSLRDLYLKGLIHGGAYFRNFTVLVPPGQLAHLNKWPFF